MRLCATAQVQQELAVAFIKGGYTDVQGNADGEEQRSDGLVSATGGGGEDGDARLAVAAVRHPQADAWGTFAGIRSKRSVDIEDEAKRLANFWFNHVFEDSMDRSHQDCGPEALERFGSFFKQYFVVLCL